MTQKTIEKVCNSVAYNMILYFFVRKTGKPKCFRQP